MELLSEKGVPTQTEVREQLGSPLAEIFFNSLDNTSRVMMGLDPMLNGPGDLLCVPPGDNMILAPPSSAQLQALTHQGILDMGTEILQQHDDIKEQEKEWAVNDAIAKTKHEAMVEKLEALKGLRDTERALYYEEKSSMVQQFDEMITEVADVTKKQMQHVMYAAIQTERSEIEMLLQDVMDTALDQTRKALTEKFKSEEELRSLVEEERFAEFAKEKEEQLAQALQQAEEDFRNRLCQLQLKLESDELTNLLQAVADQKEECATERKHILDEFQAKISQLEAEKEEKEIVITQLEHEAAHANEDIKKWQAKLKKIVQEFQRYINFALRSVAGQAQYLLSVDHILSLDAEARQTQFEEPNLKITGRSFDRIEQESFNELSVAQVNIMPTTAVPINISAPYTWVDERLLYEKFPPKHSGSLTVDRTSSFFSVGGTKFEMEIRGVELGLQIKGDILNIRVKGAIGGFRVFGRMDDLAVDGDTTYMRVVEEFEVCDVEGQILGLEVVGEERGLIIRGLAVEADILSPSEMMMGEVYDKSPSGSTPLEVSNGSGLKVAKSDINQPPISTSGTQMEGAPSEEIKATVSLSKKSSSLLTHTSLTTKESALTGSFTSGKQTPVSPERSILTGTPVSAERSVPTESPASAEQLDLIGTPPSDKGAVIAESSTSAKDSVPPKSPTSPKGSMLTGASVSIEPSGSGLKLQGSIGSGSRIQSKGSHTSSGIKITKSESGQKVASVTDSPTKAISPKKFSSESGTVIASKAGSFVETKETESGIQVHIGSGVKVSVGSRRSSESKPASGGSKTQTTSGSVATAAGTKSGSLRSDGMSSSRKISLEPIESGYELSIQSPTIKKEKPGPCLEDVEEGGFKMEPTDETGAKIIECEGIDYVSEHSWSGTEEDEDEVKLEDIPLHQRGLEGEERSTRPESTQDFIDARVQAMISIFREHPSLAHMFISYGGMK